MKLARALRCCCGFDVVVGLAILAGIVAAAVPAMADSTSARRGAMAASMISLGNAQGGYNISVQLLGTGTGSVVDDLGQISCEADCNGNYGEEVEVTLTANAAPGSYFAGWSGSGCAGTGPCVITVPDSGAFVTATFETNPNVDVDFIGTGSGSVEYQPGGNVCSNDCGSSFPPGTEVTLTATADPGSYFAGWSGGGCSGTGPCVITLDTFGVLVDARFETNPTVDVDFVGSGSGSVEYQPGGTVCSNDCGNAFPPGTEVTLTATANPGSYFAGWSGGGCSGTGPCVITVDTFGVLVDARFETNPTIEVLFDGTGEGRVEFSPGMGLCTSVAGPCSEGFAPGTVVTLTPLAEMGSFFSGWSGGCTGTGPCEITMGTTQVFVTATFTQDPEFDIVFAGTGMGQVTTQPGGALCLGFACGQRYPPGTDLTLTAAPSPGSFFEGWFAGGPGGPMCSGTDPCSFTTGMLDASITAQFRLNEPPVASCRDVTIDATAACVSLFIDAADVDDGSSDPDSGFGDQITLSLSYSGPFPLGQSTVSLTVTDLAGSTSSCTATVTVLANDCNNNGQPDTCDVGSGGSLDCNDNWVPDECECFWCNVREPFGAEELAPDVNAQLSHLGGGTPCGEKVADDFYLEPGCVHRITAVRGRMLTTSYVELLRARVELYEDCDGKPVDEPFFTADYQQDDPIPSEVLSFQLGPDGQSTLVTYRFDLCDACLWLEGGKTYWVSIIGLTDNIDMVDLSYWVAGDERLPLLGSIPVKRSGTPGATWGSCEFGPWESIEDCCIGCVNMDFCVDGYSCPIIWDNGDVDLVARGGSASGAHQQYNERTADSFVVKTCRDEELCLIEAWIWTNCDPAYGFIEFYEDLACGPPKLEDEPFRRYDGEEVEARKYDETWVVNGRTYHLWRLQVKAPDITLIGGHNYWLSAGAVSTGNFNTNSFFAWSKYGCDPCNGTNTFRITPGQHRTLRPPATEWADVLPARDFAFTIAAKAEDAIPQDGEDPQGPFGTPDCIGDTNNDGNVAVDDIFTFLAAWFSGCP